MGGGRLKRNTLVIVTLLGMLILTTGVANGSTLFGTAMSNRHFRGILQHVRSDGYHVDLSAPSVTTVEAHDVLSLPITGNDHTGWALFADTGDAVAYVTVSDSEALFWGYKSGMLVTHTFEMATCDNPDGDVSIQLTTCELECAGLCALGFWGACVFFGFTGPGCVLISAGGCAALCDCYCNGDCPEGVPGGGSGGGDANSIETPNIDPVLQPVW